MKKSDTNEWVTLDGEEATIGITKEASSEFNEIVFVELPKRGGLLSKGDEAAVLESTKAAADSYAPVSGEVTAVNEELKENPQWITEDPHGKGWLYRVKVSNAAEYENLDDYVTS